MHQASLSCILSSGNYFGCYSTFRAVWIRGAGVKPLRGGVAPTPPVPNSCENRCTLCQLFYGDR
jgi:hypothetical protein